MMFHEASRWFLLLLLLVPLVWWRYLWRGGRVALRYSSVRALQAGPAGWRTRAMVVLPIVRTLALVMLVVVLARPQKGNEQTRVQTEGIAIQLIVDRSGSMRAMDFSVAGKPVDRLTAVRKVVNAFVAGDDTLDGRPDDLIGLVSFARYADSLCPLTLDHGYLLDAMRRTEIVVDREEDGTAIGDAIALGVERLQSLDRQRRIRNATRIVSRVIILLTDGENNAGKFDPETAAQMAASAGIKVYTIGAGTQGTAPMPVNMFGQTVIRQVPVSIDEDTLKMIADRTGGQYFRATDTDSLADVYGEIDALEKTKTEEKRYLDYRELATESVEWHGIRMPPLLLVVFVLCVVEVVLSQTLLRRVP